MECIFCMLLFVVFYFRLVETVFYQSCLSQPPGGNESYIVSIGDLLRQKPRFFYPVTEIFLWTITACYKRVHFYHSHILFHKDNYNLIIMQLSSCVLISLIRQVSRRFWQKMSFDCKINLVSAIRHFFHTHHTFEVKVMKFISYTNNIKVYLVKRHQHNFILW